MEVPTAQNNFKFFNPNPTAKKMYKSGSKKGQFPRWDKPDCVIRAYCGATGLSWIDAFDELCEIGRARFDVPNSRETLDAALKARGFVSVSCHPKRGEKRPTVSELAEQKAGSVCVFNVSNHEVCAKNGSYHDVWDCGQCAVYTYWEKI